MLQELKMTDKIRELKAANVLFIRKFSIDFLKRYINLDFQDSFWGDIFSFQELLRTCLPNYKGYLQNLISNLISRYPVELQEIAKVDDVDLTEIRSVIRELNSEEKIKGCEETVFEITRNYISALNTPDVTDDNSYIKAEKTLKDYLGLNDTQTRVITSYYVMEEYREFYCLTRSFRGHNLFENRNIEELCLCLNFQVDDYLDAQRVLSQLGIIDTDNLAITSNLIRNLYNPFRKEDSALWYEIPEKKQFSLDSFLIDKCSMKFLKKILTNALNKPLNILLYGDPGTGKKTLIKSLSCELGIKIFKVANLKKDDERKLSLHACMNLARKYKGKALVLADKADNLLDKLPVADDSDSTDSHSLLFNDCQKVSIVWLTSRSSWINLSVRNCFDFSLSLDLVNTKMALKQWQRVLNKYDADNYISTVKLVKLNRKYRVPIFVMDRSVEYAKKLSSDGKEFYALLKTQLKAYNSLRMGGDVKEALRRIFCKMSK